MTDDTPLTGHPDAFHAISIPIPLKVEFAENNGKLNTLEGEVYFHKNDAIITGVNGERWPVSRERFSVAYEPIPPTRTGESGLYSKRPREVLALIIKSPVKVRLSSGRGVLTGNAGDILVEYSPGDQSIVAKDIFEKTYRRTDR